MGKAKQGDVPAPASLAETLNLALVSHKVPDARPKGEKKAWDETS